MTLSAYERETSVVLNDEEAVAHVYTAQPATMRRLARHPQAVLIARHEDERGRVTGACTPEGSLCLSRDLPKALISIRVGNEDERGRVTGEEWDLPKALISIRVGKRPVSQAQREVLRRARALQKGHFASQAPVGAEVSHDGGPGVEAESIPVSGGA